MKLDRNINGTGRGKYGLIKTRRLAEIQEAADHESRNIKGVRDIQRNERVRYAISILEEAGVLDWGAAGTESEFFVIKLRDRYAQTALMAYALEAFNKADDAGQYGDEVADLARRAGRSNPFCKKPD